MRLWKGTEAYLVPEVIAERPFSDLRGLGGAIQNFELQKTGAMTPTLYRSRAYVRQRVDLGGERVRLTPWQWRDVPSPSPSVVGSSPWPL